MDIKFYANNFLLYYLCPVPLFEFPRIPNHHHKITPFLTRYFTIFHIYWDLFLLSPREEIAIQNESKESL